MDQDRPPPSPDASGLRALFLNCTLEKSPRTSHTRGLIDVSAAHHPDAGS